MVEITTLTRLKFQLVADFQSYGLSLEQSFRGRCDSRLLASVAAFRGFEVLFAVDYGQDVTGADCAISWGNDFGGQVRFVGCWGLSHVVSG